MKIAGIIAEYNPFHTGHAYHIQKTRKITGADYIIVVMSGDFVQRGGPAFLPKHQRAKMALLGGADLVFELPSTHSCQSAEYFARSGVQLLDGLGCVDYLSFGSESGEIAPLKALGDYLAEEPEAFRKILQEELKSGMSFPAARRNALLKSLAIDKSLQSQVLLPGTNYDSYLAQPNNILAIEYCKAINCLGSSIQPITVQRTGSQYHEEELGRSFPSASAVRKFCLLLQEQKNQDISEVKALSSCFPSEVFSFIRSENILEHIVTEEDFSLPLHWLLMDSDAPKLTRYQDISYELANRLINRREEYQNINQFISLVKTKELTYSRISRALFHALLGIEQIPALSYARLLGFRKSATPVLTQIKSNGTLPLLSKPADASSMLTCESVKLFEQNTRIANLYEMILSRKRKERFIHEYSKQMVILP